MTPLTVVTLLNSTLRLQLNKSLKFTFKIAFLCFPSLKCLQISFLGWIFSMLGLNLIWDHACCEGWIKSMQLIMERRMNRGSDSRVQLLKLALNRVGKSHTIVLSLCGSPCPYYFEHSNVSTTVEYFESIAILRVSVFFRRCRDFCFLFVNVYSLLVMPLHPTCPTDLPAAFILWDFKKHNFMKYRLKNQVVEKNQVQWKWVVEASPPQS